MLKRQLAHTPTQYRPDQNVGIQDDGFVTHTVRALVFFAVRSCLRVALNSVTVVSIWLQTEHRIRELTLFDLGLDSKLRACDLVKLKVWDICHGDRVSAHAIVMQQKTSSPVQFEITEPTRDAVSAWIKAEDLNSENYLFPSRIHESPHLGTRQYARIVDTWVSHIGLDTAAYGTHSMRRTKASLIYKRTKNLRAVQLLLGHTKLESTVRYLGVEVDDALEMAEETEI